MKSYKHISLNILVFDLEAVSFLLFIGSFFVDGIDFMYWIIPASISTALRVFVDKEKLSDNEKGRFY